MKAKVLKSIRTTACLPVLAVTLSIALVTGQLLKCCRLNETILATASHVLHVLSPFGEHQDHADGHLPGVAHPGCHSHAPGPETQYTTHPEPMDGPEWQTEDPCRLHKTLALTGLPTAANDFSVNFPVSVAPLSIDAALGFELVGKPRPQNKSSPPVYLLTLRLLV